MLLEDVLVLVGQPGPTQIPEQRPPEHEIENEVTDPFDVMDVKPRVFGGLLDRDGIRLVDARLVGLPKVLDIEVPKIPELDVEGVNEAEEIALGKVDEAEVEEGVVEPWLEEDVAVVGLAGVEDVRLPPVLEVAVPDGVGLKIEDVSEVDIGEVELCEVNEASLVEDMVDPWLDEDTVVDELPAAEFNEDVDVEPIGIEVEVVEFVELGIVELGEVDKVPLVELCELGDTNVVADVAELWLDEAVPFAEFEIAKPVEVELVDINELSEVEGTEDVVENEGIVIGGLPELEGIWVDGKDIGGIVGIDGVLGLKYVVGDEDEEVDGIYWLVVEL
ncbi:MAG: hypothetical protein Q9213_005488 [Squamulea squamosa]